MTREELHAKVWSQPMRTLAKSMGISDVALAKRCKAANVPVPPRGWWARKEAGKPVTVQPLPALPFAMANYFPALAPDEGRVDDNAHDAKTLTPPLFRDLATVREEIVAAVKPIKVPATLTNPHPIVARLLKQDAQRKPDPSAISWLPDRQAPKFAKPVQQRRLRILSCILTELERLGCKVSGSTHAGEKFSLRIGGSWTYIFFGVEGGAWPSHFHREGRGAKKRDAEQLRFDLVEHDDRAPPKRVWREDSSSLEAHATEIVRGVLLQAEEDARESAVLHHSWRVEDQARKGREAKLAAERAEADRGKREAAAAAARIEALIGGAEAFERAAYIRRYVAAVRASAAVTPERSLKAELDRWAEWALAEADAIDPVLSRRFLNDLGG